MNTIEKELEMGRKRHTKMKITDARIENGVMIIGLEVQWGKYTWRQGFSIVGDNINNFSIDVLKQKALEFAAKKREEEVLKEKTLKQVQDFMKIEVWLD